MPLMANVNELIGTHNVLFVTLDTLRYDVETEAGLVLKVDVRDSWHHRLLAVGEPLQLGFPASAVLTLPDE